MNKVTGAGPFGSCPRDLLRPVPATCQNDSVIDVETLAAAGSEERELLGEIDLTRLPRHVAVIMDGNGRWARQRGSPRVEGHRAGISWVREVGVTCARLDLDALRI